tara:strand:+ start:258 stop:542 length:285 start_codon:yes stop_codon:yes gene_type:complete
MTKRYKQAREDYEFLKKHHEAEVYDITGGFNLDEHCFDLLESPTKTAAARVYEDLIKYSFNIGFESESYGNTSYDEPDLENEKVKEIYERHGLI